MAQHRWSGDAPDESAPLDLLVYRSQLIGADPDLVVWGGGNTSVKLEETDHRGRSRRVMRIKGSGTDLKTITAAGFPGIFLDDVLPLREREAMTDEEMVAYLEHCLVEPRGSRPSIETLLHAFLPFRHVDHTHADAIVTLTNTPNGEAAVRAALGNRVAIVPWIRPGFELARLVADLGDTEAVILLNHGLVTWGDTAEESYSKTIEIVNRAERWLAERSTSQPEPAATAPPAIDLAALLLRLRGRLGHRILRTWTGEPFRALAARPDIAELAASGPATADHVLRIRPWACVLTGDDPVAAVDEWEARYRAWFAEHTGPGLAMLDPLPRVFILPGVGVITTGKSEREAAMIADIALHTLSVAARGADAHGAYRALQGRDLFDVEYWPLELYKLTLAPPPRDFEGRIIWVTGAASGIGRTVARHLAGLGAFLVLLDRDGEGLQRTAEQVQSAGAGCRCFTLDLADEAEVRRVARDAITAVGGVDGLVANAGIPAAGHLHDLDSALWRRSLEVNTTAHFILTQEALRALTAQGMGGSLVFIASKNAFGPGAGFGAYSVAKAGQIQLMRIAALEGGAHGIRANAINPDAVFDDSKLWSDEVRRQRAEAHGVPVEQIEQFYANRTLLKTTVTGQDVAEAAAFLLSDRSRATTGTVITVDGGVAAAFPR